MIKFTLFLVRILKKPVQWLGVDFEQFEILLNTRLTIDFRSGSSAFQTSGRKKQTFGMQFFLFTIFGLMMGLLSLSVKDLMMSLTIFFTLIMVMLAMTLISEFTSVLFDHRDNQILLPRPVSNRTLLLFRLVHIQFYIGYIALALSLATGVLVAVKYNVIAVLIYFFAVGLSTWLSLVSTTFIYLLISKIVDSERFKDIITYVQIVFAILIFAGYQLLPRLVGKDLMQNTGLTIKAWTYFFPPAWFAGLVKLSQVSVIAVSEFALAVIAVIIPVAGAILLVRFLSRGFENILGEGTSESSVALTQKSKPGNITERIINFFCSSEIEKAGWRMAVSTTKRDRKFKQSVYPQFGMVLVIAIVILKPDLKNAANSLHESGGFSKYLFLIIFGFTGSTAVLQLPFTDSPEASWIYRALPVKETGHILTGAVKSMLMRFFAPLYLIVTIPAVWFWGYKMVPQILLGGLGVIMLVLFTIILQRMDLPFTQPREMQRKGTNSITAIISMIMMGLLTGLIYGTSLIPAWVTSLLCGLFAVSIFLLFSSVRRWKFKMD
jgi:ABC-2 type transport system permease protein